MGKRRAEPGQKTKHPGNHHRSKPNKTIPPAIRELKNYRETVDEMEALEELGKWQPKKKKL